MPAINYKPNIKLENAMRDSECNQISMIQSVEKTYSSKNDSLHSVNYVNAIDKHFLHGWQSSISLFMTYWNHQCGL